MLRREIKWKEESRKCQRKKKLPNLKKKVIKVVPENVALQRTGSGAEQREEQVQRS